MSNSRLVETALQYEHQAKDCQQDCNDQSKKAVPQTANGNLSPSVFLRSDNDTLGPESEQTRLPGSSTLLMHPSQRQHSFRNLHDSKIVGTAY